MILDIFNKIFVVSYIISCLTILRHGYYFVQAYFTSTEEEPVKYKVSKTALLFLGISIAYVLSIFFIGIKI